MDELYNDVLFPQALMYGMTYEQFWNDDPQIFWVYANAYNKIKEIEFKEKNYMMWLNGQYTLLAMAQVMTNAFSKSKKNVYPKQPFGEEKKTLSPKQKFEIIAAQFNSSFKKKQQ